MANYREIYEQFKELCTKVGKFYKKEVIISEGDIVNAFDLMETIRNYVKENKIKVDSDKPVDIQTIDDGFLKATISISPKNEVEGRISFCSKENTNIASGDKRGYIQDSFANDFEYLMKRLAINKSDISDFCKDYLPEGYVNSGVHK